MASGLTKPIYKNKHKFETLLSQMRIVQSCKEELKPKDGKIHRLLGFLPVMNRKTT